MLDNETFSEYRNDVEDEGPSPARLISFYWGLLRKYYWILLITAIVGGTAGFFWTKQQPRLFKAKSEIIFHQNQVNVLGRNIERVDLVDPGGIWQFEQFWNTQQKVLGSRWFGERVVQSLDLLKDGTHIPLEIDGEPLGEEARMRSAVGMIQGMVAVSLQGESRVAEVEVVSTDAKLAKEVANAYAHAYVAYTKELHTGGLDKIVNFFDTQVGSKRKELLDAKAAMHRFKRDNSEVLSTSYEEQLNLNAANIEAVNTELNQVENELSASDALLGQLREMERKGSSQIDVASFAGSQTLTALLGQQRELRRELVSLQTVYGPKHEKVKGINDQLSIVVDGIDQEVNRSISKVENQVAYLKRRRGSLRSRLSDLQSEADTLTELGLSYYQLKDEAESLKQLYDTMLSRSEELDINSMLEFDKIEVLEEAEVPGAPFSPNLPYNLGLSLLFGLGFGGGIIFLIAALDNTVKGEEDVRRYTSAPMIGALPAVDAATLKSLLGPGDSPIDTITHYAPKSSFAEGIKTLRTNLMFMTGDNPPRLSLVTSPGPGEGKTLISTNMAIAIAQSGRKTLLVDNDLRRPRVHKAVGLDNSIGIADVLIGDATLEDAVRATDIPNLFVLTAGHIPPNPTELLHTESFERVLEALSEQFDRVIFDSPPIGAVADALILSRSVDAVLLVLKFGQTRRDMLKRSIEQLEGIGAPLLGCVLNDIRKDAGYGYQYYYYHRYGYDDRPDATTKVKKAS